MILFHNTKIYIIAIFLLYEIYLFYPELKKKIIILKIYILKSIYNNSIIEIDISSINSNYGPGSFIKGINQVLPFFWRNCYFISSSYNNRNIKPDLYFIPYPQFHIKQYTNFIRTNLINKFILGPIFVPINWFNFPDKNIWIEKRFSYLLNYSKGIAVHSLRVRDFLMNRTNTNKMINKFKIVRPCTNIKPVMIKSFKDREIDILFYEKYSDIDRRKQGLELIKLFKNTSKRIINIEYGYYNKTMINNLANNSKFIIYFSFFDTGAIGLKEIQNYGVISFSHQKEFIINNETSYYIPELANTENMMISFLKIMKIIEYISNTNIRTELIAEKNQLFNKCENTLSDLCGSLT